MSKRTAPPRRIASLPLREVWNEANEVVATVPLGDLAERALRDLLRLGSPRFVVADVGLPPRWIPAADAFRFWASEVRPHLVDPAEDGFDLAAFPDGYGYLATRWAWDQRTPLVVLRVFH